MAMRPHPLDKDYTYLSIRIPEACPLVVIVTLRRPRKLNAIHAPFWREIGHAFGKLGRMGDACRCILLTGSGRGFCAGIDIQDLSFTSSGSSSTDDPARTGLAMISKVQQMQACFTQLEACPVPVVVAVHGMCIGAGIDLACCADIRMCASDTTFSVREVRMGLAADVGTLQRLPKITGNNSWVSDVCLTGRNFDAKEALSMGFVSQVVTVPSSRDDGRSANSTATNGPTRFLQQAIELCQTIAVNSPVAVVGTKKALLYARDHTVADGLEQIISYNALALQSRDLKQSVQAAMEKRQATFSNLFEHSRL